VIWGLFRATISAKAWKPFSEINWGGASANHGRRLLYILGGILGLVLLVLIAEYFGFFKMIDFYLYEDY